MKNNLICIIGPDGSGKTTQAKILIERMREKKIDVEYRWLRFYHFFSLPLLCYARISGYTETHTIHNKKMSYHNFSRSQLLCQLYPMTLFIDTFLFYVVKLYFPLFIRKKVIVCDRCIYDTIIDVMISTGIRNIKNIKFFNYYLKLVPKNTHVFLMTSDEQTLRERRIDVKMDRELENKIFLYEEFGKMFDFQTIDSSLPIIEINKKIEIGIFNE